MNCRSLLLTILLTPTTLAAQAPVGATASAPEVVSIGTGEVLVPPDRVHLTVAVASRGASASDAGRANADRMTRVLAALRRQGLADSVLTTSGYAVEEEETYEGERRDPPVYVARNAIGVSMTDLAGLGSIIDSALAAAAGGTLGPVIEITIDPGYSSFAPFGYDSDVNRLSQVVVVRTPLAPSDVRIAVRVKVRSVFGGAGR